MLALKTEPLLVSSSFVVPVWTGLPPLHPGNLAPESAPIQKPVAISVSEVVSRYPASHEVDRVSLKLREIPTCMLVVSESKPVSGW